MLIEQGDISVPFFVVITGEVEIVRPSGAYETLVTVHGHGEFTGEVNMLSGRRSLVRAHATKAGEVIDVYLCKGRLEERQEEETGELEEELWVLFSRGKLTM